ncbi:hypothetical protein ZYGR_0I03690 [Zygosaccharomyces rouxii]|uniref:HORMA domain-containing protein n=1 Tax=Zygosaccharomyces rouxii TaxID=4956 RepID=A0A1Q2ZX28_ZYGRO|nr:hypothetical protein ZYGR_0I03690 [Zygosaccharomyces rouxii]
MSTRQLLHNKAKTKTDITTEQSQKLVQTMLTMSFGCLAFLRGLFPDESFVDQRFVPEKVEKNYNKQTSSQTNSIKIKTLVRGKFTEVDLLLDWLEKGVFQAIKLKYLKALSLGIFLNEHDSTNLLENYTFTFDYDVENNVRLSINDESSTISLLDSRKMAQQLMRRFIIITQSLEPLPQKKYLTVRLMFNDDCPRDYQPHLFKDASFDKPATIKIPSSSDSAMFSVGSLDTKHHKLAMKVFSATDIDAENSSEFDEIDPFEFVEDKGKPNVSNITSEPSQSQTSNVLGDYLKSSQPEIQPTQAIHPHTSAAEGATTATTTTTTVRTTSHHPLKCECGTQCAPSSTKLKCCKNCRKRVHGICYGNYQGAYIEKCLLCLFGSKLLLESSELQDLMLLRKCYRYLARARSLPSSTSNFIKQLIGPKEINEEIRERFAFCMSVLFQDEILTIGSEWRKPKSSQTLRFHNNVQIDIPNIVAAEHGLLQEGEEYNINFTFQSQHPHSCYMDIVPQSKSQVDRWLDEITELRNKSFSLPSSCNLQSLDISDNIPQNQSLPTMGQKRKHVDLDQYLEEENSSVLNDTLDITAAHSSRTETPKKIRKISVSKKSLRSVW